MFPHQQKVPFVSIVKVSLKEMYGALHQRSMAEVATEVTTLAGLAARSISPDAETSPVSDQWRARAVGVLWGAGVHGTDAEDLVDEIIADMMLDRLDLL
jgi:hypothetical protein